MFIAVISTEFGALQLCAVLEESVEHFMGLGVFCQLLLRFFIWQFILIGSSGDVCGFTVRVR